MQLSVIIVNYNVKHFLEQCLCSVRLAAAGISTEVFVVDNASQDESEAYLEPLFPEVHFIWNQHNVGFSKANNQAVQLASGKYILFLNPDTLVPEDGFEKCIRFMEQHPDAGALGIRMLDGKGLFLPESKRSFPSPIVSLYKLSGLTALFPKSKLFGKYHLGYLDPLKNHEVDVLSGAFMLVKKEVLDITGSFDESFFMYGEDIDLSYRIQQTPCVATGGTYKNYYFSETSILHFKGESTRKGSLNYIRIFYKAMSRFVDKHGSASRAGFFRALINIAIWLRASVSVLKQFVQKIGLPFLDALWIILAYWLIKEVWVTYVRPEIQYPGTLLMVSITGFALLFLLVSYYTGLYNSKFRYKDLLYSTLAALIIILAAYSLIPETLRFSRGIVALGSLFSFGILACWRWILLKAQFLEQAVDEEEPYILVAGTHQQMEAIKTLIQHSGRSQNISGFISPLTEDSSLGTLSDLQTILRNAPHKELIICQSPELSFSKLIGIYEQVGKQIKLRLHAAGSKSIVGSDSKNITGEVLSKRIYKLDHQSNRRLKRLLDLLSSVLMLLVFPLHFLLNKRPIGVLSNALQVLLNTKTWIGYTGGASNLPKLKPAVLGPAGIPGSLNQLNTEGVQMANEWYAESYDPLYDLTTLMTHYKNVGIK